MTLFIDVEADGPDAARGAMLQLMADTTETFTKKLAGAHAAYKAREALPPVGGVGSPTGEALTRYQAADPSGRPWVAVTEFRPYSDHTTNWYGPVIEDCPEDHIVLDIAGPVTFAYTRITIRRAA